MSIEVHYTYAMSVVLPLFCVFISFIIIWKIVNRKRAQNLPPLAEGGLPILGHTFVMLANRERIYHTFTKTILGASVKKGNEVVIVRCGFLDWYVVTDPDNGLFMLNSCQNKDPITKMLKPVLGNGLITADEPIWKIHRKWINPTFNQNVLYTYLTEFNNCSRQLANDLAQEIGKGSFNQIPYVKQTVLKVVCVTIVGFNVDDKHYINEVGKAVETFTDSVVQRARTFWLYNDYMFSWSNLKKKQDAGKKILEDLLDKVLEKKSANTYEQVEKSIEYNDSSKPRYKSFIELLLELSKDEALTNAEIRHEISTFIGAAYDTTAHVLGLTLLNIGSYPDVQQKVFEELQDVFEGSYRDVEKQDLSKLKYLEAVIKETMRLYPVVSIVGRSVEKDLNFKKYTVPAGNLCLLSIYHVGRHAIWGPDSEQFRPGRWLDGSLSSNALKHYAVFGLGKRSCIGSNYSMMSMKTTLSHVLRRYRVTGDVTQLVQNLDVVVSPISGHHISIEPRELKAKAKEFYVGKK